MFDVWTSYTIDLFGSKESIKKAGIILAKILQDESIVGSKHIVIRDTNRFVWVDDISQIAKAIANSSPDLTSFTISGRVDNSSSSNAYMDFLIEYKNHELSVQSSCWYSRIDADEYDSYEDFCEDYYGFSREEYEAALKSPHFLLNDGSNQVVTKASLDTPEMIDLDAKTIYIKESALSLSPVPLCRCECGNEVTMANDENLLSIYCDKVNATCPKCGKRFEVYLE